MKNFVVSARKYRPAIFSQVLGQPHITTTLKNAIKDNHLAQAFLFCGPRGVGKTTCARILAKTINCQQRTADTEACNTCTACKSFNANGVLNVYELDAASNNSVEDIRELVAQVRYPPQAGTYKVYIIDEVHMLSNAAFNAFLKTLEEPPSYALFILATTERHKIIPTILSRCQIFDFQRIQPQAIVQQLQTIAAQEGIAYEEEALHLISQKADGALRDALSIFDLIVTFGSGKVVTYQATLDNLHVLDHTYYFKLTEALLQGNMATVLLIYDEIIRAGFDGHHFIVGLSEHFRNLMVCQDTATCKLLEVADRVQQKYTMQAKQVSVPFLYNALKISQQCDLQYKSSYNKRLHVELALMALVNSHQPFHTTTTPCQESVQPQQASKTAVLPVTTLLHQPLQNNGAPYKIENKVAPPHAVPADAKQPTLQETMQLPQIDQLKKDIGQATSKQVQPIAVTMQQPFTKAALMAHWKAYAGQLKNAGKLSEYSVLNQKIALEGTTIMLNLINPVQQDILVGIKEDLIADLRVKMQNKHIDVRGVIVQPKKHSKPYTAQEKFNCLVTKYPDLRLLQQKLLLEVEA